MICQIMYKSGFVFSFDVLINFNNFFRFNSVKYLTQFVRLIYELRFRTSSTLIIRINFASMIWRIWVNCVMIWSYIDTIRSAIRGRWSVIDWTSKYVDFSRLGKNRWHEIIFYDWVVTASCFCCVTLGRSFLTWKT